MFELQFVFSPFISLTLLRLGEVWLLHSKSLSGESFYPHSKRPLEKRESLDRAKSSLLQDAQQKLWIQVKHPKLPICIQLLLLLASWYRWCPPSRAKARPAAHPTRCACVQAGCGVVHVEAPSLQKRWPAWPVEAGTPAHVKASGSSEHSVGFSWCHCTFWKLPSTLASLAFPLADFIAKCAFACVSGGLWGVGWSGRNSCLQGLVLCNYVQLELSVDRDRFTSYK